jgi:hypothetical protein
MMLGFLSGGVSADRIVSPVFYILETLDWFEGVLRCLDGNTALRETTKILIVEMQIVSSDRHHPFTNGVSCVRLLGEVPRHNQTIRTLFGEPRTDPDKPCNPAKAIHYQSGHRDWEPLPNERLLPFQVLQMLTPPATTAEEQLRKTLTLVRPASAHICPEGLVYRFPREKSYLRNSPVLGWDLIRKAVVAHRPNAKQPKKQTVLVESNPGLKIGGLHG